MGVTLSLDDVAVVIIGRNEGARLKSALGSLMHVPHRVYVDSGSLDGSTELARGLGVAVVELRSPPGFTAARARNAGLAYVAQEWPNINFVQMVDGDCQVEPGWLETAAKEIRRRPLAAVVFGRRMEMYPTASIYNMACDIEWRIPPGPAKSCGGDAMFRISALHEVGGFNSELVAGEEPELCLRLRGQGWIVYAIDAPMTIHDVALTKFRQWWIRSKRTGYAMAELLWRHRGGSDPSWRRLLLSAAGWSIAMLLAPCLLIIGGMTAHHPTLLIGAFVATILLSKGVLIAWRTKLNGLPMNSATSWTYLIIIAKLAQIQGAISFLRKAIKGSASELIEYKQPGA